MKYLLIILGFIFCFNSMCKGTCFYKETLIIGTSTVVGISDSAKDPELSYALVSVEDANLRFWYDGTNPSTDTGHLLLQNNMIGIEGQNNLRQLKMISAGTTSVKVRLSYEK